MKQEINVTAHRVATEYDKKDILLSTIELRLPPDDLDFMSEVLLAQECDKDIRSTLVVRSLADGDPRRLPLTLKSSKMRNFVPVAVFTKYGDARDNLTELFSTGRYGRFELTLIVEIVEEKDDQDALDFERDVTTPVVEEPEHIALARMLGEGCPHCPDLVIDPLYFAAERHLALCSAEELCELLESIGIDPTRWDDPKRDQEQDMAEQRKLLLAHWEKLNLTVVLQNGEA